jgi:hypothetical protein
LNLRWRTSTSQCTLAASLTQQQQDLKIVQPTRKIQKITILILGPIVILILYLSVKLRKDEAENIEKFGVKGVGTLTNHGLKTIDISYDYQGKYYTYTCGIPYSDLVEGEQYEIEIYTKDPSRILVDMDKPHIDSIKYKWATIKPTVLKPLWLDDSKLVFKYQIKEETFRRLQEYYHSSSIPNDLTKLIVIYRIDRPEISYLVYTDQIKTSR